MDRRQQKTRAAVLTAFEALLAQKRYEQITVQDIIDRANIGRSTFYAHFETRDSLLDYTCRKLFAHVFDDHLSSETSHDFSGGERTPDRMLTHILYHLKDDRKRYARIFACESADLFWRYFQSQFEGLIRKEGLLSKAREKDVPEEYYLHFYCSAYMETVKWWFRTDLGVSPEDLTLCFRRVTD